MKNINNQNYTILGNVKTNREIFNWFNLLIDQNEEKKAELSVIFDRTGRNIISMIIRYRRKLLQNNPFQGQLNMQDKEQFRQQLQHMFWEPVSISDVNTIIRVMQKNRWDADSLVKAHEEKPEHRIWKLICCPCKYIA